MLLSVEIFFSLGVASRRKSIHIDRVSLENLNLFHNQWIGVVKNTGPSHVMLFLAYSQLESLIQRRFAGINSVGKG